MATLRRVVERIARLAVVATGRGGCGAHLFVVAGQVDLVHIGGLVCYAGAGFRVRSGNSRWPSAWCRKVVNVTQWQLA